MKKFGVCVAILFACFVAYTSVFSATVRYRLTLEAEVDREPKTGSGVIEVSYSKNNDPISSAGFTIGIRGEAVALDLGPRGTLFALLRGDKDSRSGPEYVLFRVFNFPDGAMPLPITSGLSKIRNLSGKVDLPLTSLPLLVRFRDLDDPKSIERVDPLDIATSFGAGAKLVRATIEIVPAGIWPLSYIGLSGEPLATGIDRRLTWLGSNKGGYLDGAFAGGGPALSNILSGGDFKNGT